MLESSCVTTYYQEHCQYLLNLQVEVDKICIIRLENQYNI